MESRKEKILKKIHIKDYTNNLEKILEKKAFSEDTKNLLLSMFYKIEYAYKDYEKTKIEVYEKSEFLEKLSNIIETKCDEIAVTSDENKKIEKLDKSKGLIVALGNEQVLLNCIIAMGQNRICLTDEDAILEDVISYLLNNGMRMSQVEALRDFNGWSWDTSVKDIDNIELNLAFQNILFLLGHEFISGWIENTSKLADYMFLALEKLKKAYGEVYSAKMMRLICKVAIELSVKTNPEQEAFWEEFIKDIKREYEKINDKKEYLEEITKQKKSITKEIEKIDKILNNNELLKQEYNSRNEKLPNKEKIFSIKHLKDRLEVERIQKVEKIKKLNDLLQPTGYVIRKEEIAKKYEFITNLNIDKKYDVRKTILEICNVFFNCFKIKIAKASTKQEIIKYIYELRYYRFIMFDEQTKLKDVEILKEKFDIIIKLLIEKALKFNCLDSVTNDEDINYEILKQVFDSKMIDLNHMIIETKVEKGKLFIEYYDTNVLENVIEVHSKKIIKLNKKTKLFI